MGCLTSRNSPLEKIIGETLSAKPQVSNEKTSIYVSNKRKLWKVCKGDPCVIRKTFMNNYRVKRLSSCKFVLRPEKLVKLDDETIGICMPYMSRDLFQLLQHPFELKRVWRGLRDVASGIAWMHAKGLAHRDVKPENIVLNKERFCLIDFDFSSPLSTYQYCGTQNYTVPRELADSWECTDRERSMRHDVYAFGKTILFVLCCAASFGIIGHTSFVDDLYDYAIVPENINNPYEGEEKLWFDIVKLCCSVEPPNTIPLLERTADTHTTVDNTTFITNPQVVYADDIVA